MQQGVLRALLNLGIHSSLGSWANSHATCCNQRAPSLVLTCQPTSAAAAACAPAGAVQEGTAR